MAYRGRGDTDMMCTATMADKQDMQGLNDRLSSYMDKVRAMGQKADFDPTKYHEAMKQLEKEIAKVKNMYQNELDKLRRELDNANREKNAAAQNSDRNQNQLDDLLKKAAQDADKNRRLADENNNLQRALADKEKENADLRAAAQAMDQQLKDMKPDYSKLLRENEDLRNRLGQEQERRKDAEDKAKKLNDQLKFNDQKNNQEAADLKNRLKAASDIVDNLENKLKDMNRNKSDDISKMMQQLRDNQAVDLKKYQKETEGALNQGIKDLQSQIDDTNREKDQLKRENQQLKDALRGQQARNAELENQLGAQKKLNKALDAAKEQDKAMADSQIRDLDDKLRDTQGQVMDKIKDFNKARDAQATLKGEIGTYRNLLDAESQRVAKTNCPVHNRVRSAGQRATFTPSSRPMSRQNTVAGGQQLNASFPQINSPSSSSGKRYNMFGPYNTTYDVAYNRRKHNKPVQAM